jgi:tRNA G46 methylase TrmB
MGKGGFTIQQSKTNQDKNIIGVEKFASVQVVPVKIVEELEIKNLKFISDDAAEITE